MMTVETSRLASIEARKAAIFDEIVRRIAHMNEVPMMAAAWDRVFEEIELEVEALVIRSKPVNGASSPEIEAMVEIWRKLENEARPLRAANDWRAAMPMAV